ncbi:MAG: 1-(5-phosphoribosyl)-5-[(5-phosphoribosylamino)methylideneamino]imidazole-4-carboxamide isomerase [Spirochaetales bacterium]|uniref:1-(5-phosphoribosyl)-5-[(5-phosphoribosylamino)methylideneamino] imidazole-4-carboxamide isomerase n=1 Tax=Candidatus Thalassospirochaeta sargassi TaxID=3119039 RepID=A0AAJ1IH14_9SPIO|nr:1-(5-phosphoribosyl)-5-[(5-phosphoribosylamino)methylideneamino]imidazole-4-carboxamide isomerase [Spirochaetales bacterium]
MIVIPAIDLINGKCVRLTKGDYDTSKIYNDDPVETAKAFEAAGAKRIHIVDLDAARGDGNNRSVIKSIRNSVSAVVETGGGIRTTDDVKELVDCGITRMIAGTVLAKDPDLVAGWIAGFGKYFIAGIDALDGEVKVSGWEKGSGLSDTGIAKASAEMGIISIVYTNIAKDGTLSGPDIENTVRIAKESGLPVILSGGISSKDDFKQVAAVGSESGIAGIITGKAIYEGRIDTASVIAEFQTGNEGSMEW